MFSLQNSLQTCRRRVLPCIWHIQGSELQIVTGNASLYLSDSGQKTPLSEELSTTLSWVWKAIEEGLVRITLEMIPAANCSYVWRKKLMCSPNLGVKDFLFQCIFYLFQSCETHKYIQIKTYIFCKYFLVGYEAKRISVFREDRTTYAVWKYVVLPDCLKLRYSWGK